MAMRWQKKRLKGMSLVEMLMAIFILLIGMEGDQTTEVFVNYISNTNAQPVFSYYNRDYPSDIINNPLATPVSVENVRLIKIHLLVNIDPINAPNNVNVESFAELRNLNNYTY